MQRAVHVVVPLRVAEQRPVLRIAWQTARIVQVVFENQVQGPGAARPFAHRAGQLVDEMRRAAVVHRVHSVEAQAVEVELLDPVQRVVDEEVAHRAARLRVEIDGRTAGRDDVGVEELRRAGAQVVAVGAGLVVDHVEQPISPRRCTATTNAFRSSSVPYAAFGANGSTPS